MKLATIVIALALLAVALFYGFNNYIRNQELKGSEGQSELTDNQAATPQESNSSKGKVPNIPLKLPADLEVRIFAEGVANARDLEFSPEGTLLVSSPSSGNVYALPDKNNDGVADTKKQVISGANIPHGLSFHNGKLFLANVKEVIRYNWDESGLNATKDKDLFALPSNGNHNRRTITFGKDGKMYVSVGSTCNVCNEKDSFSATVILSDADGNSPRIFAKGLRNAPFIQINPSSNELWGTEMGRDLLGDNIPPDEIDIIRDGKDYGWPNCWGNKVEDKNFNPAASCGNTEPPIFEIPAHSAPLGLAFINSKHLPSDWQGDLLVGYHGSWNRSTPTGYKVVRLKVSGNSIEGAEDFLTGFIDSSARAGSDAKGRPVDIAFDKDGKIYISDDKAGNVYVISKK